MTSLDHFLIHQGIPKMKTSFFQCYGAGWFSLIKFLTFNLTEFNSRAVGDDFGSTSHDGSGRIPDIYHGVGSQ